MLFTEAIPPEGLHIMEFDVLGRDQCLLGVATPDVDVETYLGHKRGGYGFFASEGTLKIDGDWKGGHGLCKFKRGDKVGVHVDMSRRTLQFSVSHWELDAASGQGTWRKTLLERIVEGLPSVLHFAVGGAAGGEISIAVSTRPTTPTKSLGGLGFRTPHDAPRPAQHTRATHTCPLARGAARKTLCSHGTLLLASSARILPLPGADVEQRLGLVCREGARARA